jgi:heme oxygenase (biliverdin-IX-beta and delta-forming)
MLLAATRTVAPARGHAHGRLRAETRALHAALEQRLVISALADREMYVRYLLMNVPCGSIELGLVRAGVRRFLPDWDRRQRRAALAEDLAMLGVHSINYPLLATASDIGAMLGWCYVLEGSRLGARAILHVVAAAEDPRVRAATRFLRHGGDKDLWGSFKTALSRIDNDAIAIARACATATTAFDCFMAADCWSGASRSNPHRVISTSQRNASRLCD